MLGDGYDTEDDIDNVLVGGGVSPMWCGLVRLHGSNDVQARPGCVAALCESRSYMDDEKENVKTKQLLMKHLWEKYGEE